MWIKNQIDVLKGKDGLYYLDYYKMLLLSVASPKEWFNEVTAIVANKLTDLKTGQIEGVCKVGVVRPRISEWT